MRLHILAIRAQPLPQPGRSPLVLGQLPIGLQGVVAVFENGVCIGVIIRKRRPRSPGIREPPEAAEGESLDQRLFEPLAPPSRLGVFIGILFILRLQSEILENSEIKRGCRSNRIRGPRF